jgi:subtilisin family serine protease
MLLAVPAGNAATPALLRAPVVESGHAPNAEYAPGHVLVGFKPGATRAARLGLRSQAGLRVIQRFRGFGMQLLRAPRGMTVPQAVRALERNPAVAWAEPDYIRHPLLNNPPLDALFAQQWDLNNTGQPHDVADRPTIPGSPVDHAGTSDADIDAPEAWGVTEGLNSVVVAVIDTGVDFSDADLSGQKWLNPADPPAGGDDDGNGLPDDNYGWDFGNNDNSLLSPTPWTGFDHGTHVGGTIAAEHNDDPSTGGVVGVCPGCRIMALKIARDSDGQMTVSREVAALNYAKAHGAQIANMSLAGIDWSNAEREAIRKSGMLVVAAAGNDSLDNDMALAVDYDGDGSPDFFSPSYPAAYSVANLITVAASNDQDRYAYSTECYEIYATRKGCAFTDWGHDSVDLAAPGVDISSTVPGGSWETWDGTSMAAPHVAGAAGLVLSQNPSYSVAQLKNAIMHGVDKPATLKTQYVAPPINAQKTGSFTRTSGRLNAFKALTASTASATPVTDGNIDHAASWSTRRRSGRVSWPADINDVFKRRLSKGHVYRITLTVPKGKDYDLFVWKPGTKEIWQQISTTLSRLKAYSVHGGAADETVQFRASATGTYYVHVSAWLFKSGSYTLRFKRIS